MFLTLYKKYKSGLFCILTTLVLLREVFITNFFDFNIQYSAAKEMGQNIYGYFLDGKTGLSYNMPPFSFFYYKFLALFSVETVHIISVIVSLISFFIICKSIKYLISNNKLTISPNFWVICFCFSLFCAFVQGFLFQNISVVINCLTIVSFALFKKYLIKGQEVNVMVKGGGKLKSRLKQLLQNNNIQILIIGLPLSLAIAIKLYPAVLLLVFLFVKKYKVFIFCALLSIFWTLFAFLIFPSDTFKYLSKLKNMQVSYLSVITNLSLSAHIHSKLLVIIILIILFIYILFISIKLYKYFGYDSIVIIVPLLFVFYAFANAISWPHHIMLIFLCVFLKIFAPRQKNKHNYILMFLLTLFLIYPPIYIPNFGNRMIAYRAIVFMVYVLIVPPLVLFKKSVLKKNCFFKKRAEKKIVFNKNKSTKKSF
jgi:hypothetical protein